jgi:hypothetical protein
MKPYRSPVRLLPIFAGSALILFVVAVPAVAFKSECVRNEGRKIAALTGEQPYGGPREKFTYESRVESVDSNVWRFIYCIGNYRQYRSILANWFRDKDRVYFNSNVPPETERPSFSDTTDKRYGTPQRRLDYDGATLRPDPDTIVRGAEVAQATDTPSLILHSAAVVDIAADPETESLVASGKYEKYQPQSFVTMKLEFVSSLKNQAFVRSEITNNLRLNFIGSVDQITKALEQWPKYLRARDSKEAGFLLKTTEPLRISGASVSTDPREVSQVRLSASSSGKVVERYGVIEITNGKETVGSFAVTYFAPD